MTLARVTAFEGGTADGVRAAAEQIRASMAGGPPEGVKSVGLTMLIDPDGGRVMLVGMFADEDDLKASEAALAAMDVPEGMGSRASVDVYEVAAEVRMS